MKMLMIASLIFSLPLVSFSKESNSYEYGKALAEKGKSKGDKYKDYLKKIYKVTPWTNQGYVGCINILKSSSFKVIYDYSCVPLKWPQIHKKSNVLACSSYNFLSGGKTGLGVVEIFYPSKKECEKYK